MSRNSDVEPVLGCFGIILLVLIGAATLGAAAGLVVLAFRLVAGV